MMKQREKGIVAESERISSRTKGFRRRGAKEKDVGKAVVG